MPVEIDQQRMKIKPAELEKEGYVLLSSLHHDELIPFLKESFKDKSIVVKWYNYLILTLLIILIAYLFVDYYRVESFNGLRRFSYFSLGIALSFVLIPLHEFLHALAYKYVGAREVSYDANWKKFYFMAMADQFVADYKEFRIVALTPFLAISISCLLFLFFPIGIWIYSVFGLLITHTLFCSGDMALLNYFEVNKEREMVTYDDKLARMSFFYEKSTAENNTSLLN